MTKRIMGVFCLAFFVVFATLTPAGAHRTIVFAWVDGDTVYTQSKFAGGRKVKDAPLTVYDSAGKELLKGRTDERGEFSFKIPQKTDLTIVVSAGEGHRGEWVVPASEFGEITADLNIPETAPAAPEKTGAPPVLERIPLPEELQMAVERALDKKLKPLFRMLAESRTQKPSFRDIFGGLGYILGLVGLGAYIHNRKRKTPSDG